ncbi:flagellar assembly protein FliH [Lentibacillus sp.]|uniref:flagellar assembly protein FliH n=1 Tax=Lentibacillus sp. TaxID=1925746 RepID=UPI002B4B0681|nr:flagellar assembly protein FliH [Lentibacillus sp.]HLS07989.1 flagellar assembly protein FliH [Lentibacillus sp.]
MSSIYSNQSNVLKERLIKVRSIELNKQDESEPSTDQENEQKHIQTEINQAYEELQQIKEQQDTLRQQTNAEIEEAKANWETEKQQYIDEARQTGYTEGFEEGKRDSLQQYKQLLTDANDIVKSATKDYYATIEQSDEAILDLAIHIAEKIIQQKLEENPETFKSIVDSAIKEIKDKSEIAIHVHPVNYDLVVRQQDEMAYLVDKDINVSVFVNEDLNEGSCLIDHPFGQIDASVDTQLQELRDILQEVSMENSQ